MRCRTPSCVPAACLPPRWVPAVPGTARMRCRRGLCTLMVRTAVLLLLMALLLPCGAGGLGVCRAAQAHPHESRHHAAGPPLVAQHSDAGSLASFACTLKAKGLAEEVITRLLALHCWYSSRRASLSLRTGAPSPLVVLTTPTSRSMCHRRSCTTTAVAPNTSATPHKGLPARAHWPSRAACRACSGLLMVATSLRMTA